MTESNVRCFRCSGRKKMFQVGSVYSLVDSGGKEVNCPLCNGKGRIKPVNEVLKEESETAKKIAEGLNNDSQIRKRKSKHEEQE